MGLECTSCFQWRPLQSKDHQEPNSGKGDAKRPAHSTRSPNGETRYPKLPIFTLNTAHHLNANSREVRVMPDDAPLSTIDSSVFSRSTIFMLDRAQPAFPR